MLSLRGIPNVLTAARILLVPPLIVLLVQGRYTAALVLAFIAGFSDWLDGALARRFGWQTRLGGILDPLADKLLMVGAYVTLGWLGHLPAWLVGLVVLRDLVIVTGGLVYHYRFERVDAEPTPLSKFNTFCQLLLMWVVLVALAGVPVPAPLSFGLIGLVGALAVGTMLQYVGVWGTRAVRIARQRRTR